MINVMGDLDDVFFPWADAIHEACGIAGLHDGKAEWASWHMWEDYGCSKELWLEVVDKATADGLYHNTEPFPGSVAAWNRIGFEVPRVGLHLVTARGFMEHAAMIREATTWWVAEYGIAHDTLTFEKDKPQAQDTLGCRFDYAIDDGVHNYVALDAAGAEVYLLDRPHNRNLEDARRVSSIDEFADIIIERHGS